MEFPSVGEHCSENTCKRLDFLPMKCDACSQVFCKDHVTYANHGCEASYRKDVQVPVCPLCNKPVPVSKGEVPDIQVGRHIDLDCQSDPAKEKRKAYVNRCSLKGCKQKELIKVECESCRRNYCLRHRHPQDHQCNGYQGSGAGVSQAGAAALSRIDNAKNRGRPKKSPPHPTPSPATAIQGSLNEDEALARALQMSLNEQPASSSGATTSPPGVMMTEEEDWALAQAIAASEQEAQPSSSSSSAPRQATTQKKKSCAVS